MKRLLPILGLLVVIILLTISVSASYTSTFEFQFNSTEVIVKGELEYSEALFIAESLINSTDDEIYDLNRSIICTLFGHDLETSNAIVREHNVSPTQPKCIEYQYRVTNCRRSSCDYIVKELICTTPLYSCH